MSMLGQSELRANRLAFKASGPLHGASLSRPLRHAEPRGRRFRQAQQIVAAQGNGDDSKKHESQSKQDKLVEGDCKLLEMHQAKLARATKQRMDEILDSVVSDPPFHG